MNYMGSYHLCVLFWKDTYIYLEKKLKENSFVRITLTLLDIQ